MGAPTRYARKPARVVLNEAEHAAALERSASMLEPLDPEVTAAAIREHYLRYCSPALNAFLTAPAYGVLFADAHSSVHPDLIGPVVTSRDEAIAQCEEARASRPEVQCVVMAGVTTNRRIALAEQGFHIPDDDLMAPGTRIFIDRYGRTPKALLRAHRREGQPLEPVFPTPRPGEI